MTTKPFTTRLDPVILLLAQKFTEKDRRPVTAVIEIALIEYAGRRGIKRPISKIESLPMSTISVEQCRGARAMLGWSQHELAEKANVSRTTIADFERGARIPHRNKMTAIRRTLETGGIEFIPENGGEAGVRPARRPSRT
ncbi:helix-turn-helix transcriptional regulator [Mesorhizobium sp. YR577]|uniref:helix-turn-helix domain-containing protein n=1 Tax=Mesorhizobium sp. YR577 TaxID=1884373 RepID=UPI001FCDB58B|nr:helix-turn-helix transcriptional regulator [Mesorhizobium sp. YR577]